MAYVKVGQIKATLAKSVAYITRPDATSDGLWVSTNTANVNPADFKAIARSFAETAERVGVSVPGPNAVLGHHVIQSFDPKEGVSTHKAHELGVQLIESMTGGSHEYVIATHLDKGHVHNHIIFNPVNLETGRRYRMPKSRLGEFRAMSDELSRAAGLSVIEREPRSFGKTGWSQQELYRVVKGDSGQQYIRTEIDKAARHARSWDELEATLLKRGIQAHRRGGANGTLSFQVYGAKRPVRDYKLGRAFTEESIMARLARASVNRIGVDASMILRETKTTMTVAVPGTKRELSLTVQKTQVVRRGRSLRLYIPASGRHVLAGKDGKLAKTVTTAGLYEFYSKPDLSQVMKNAETRPGPSWAGQLAMLRELTREVNARGRWMREQGVPPTVAITNARERLNERHMAYQSALVAVGDHLAQPAPDAQTVRVLESELRTISRELTTTEQDVRALMNITREGEPMTAADKLARSAEQEQAQARRNEDRAQRDRLADHTRDRETPAHEQQMDAERDGQQQRHDDQAVDRNGPMSLEDRLQKKLNEIRADAEEDAELTQDAPTRDDDRTQGRGR
ncbi:MAG: relaxase/mobilization nuclease domain-containing protein [Microbacterium sp.]|uniref:relaxase/mobilization nuclease domain-containing protein n=1 Tax=Microbacterium sp. TaxID=51671 RepID=UPI003F998FB1